MGEVLSHLRDGKTEVQRGERISQGGELFNNTAQSEASGFVAPAQGLSLHTVQPRVITEISTCGLGELCCEFYLITTVHSVPGGSGIRTAQAARSPNHSSGNLPRALRWDGDGARLPGLTGFCFDFARHRPWVWLTIFPSVALPLQRGVASSSWNSPPTSPT